MFWFKPLRAELNAAPHARHSSPPWTAKNWGQTRRLLQCGGVEIWEAFARKGHRTSFHLHPMHRQIVYLLSGTIEVITNRRRLVVRDNTPVKVDARTAHELRFFTDSHFVEVYRGHGDVMASIQRIYQ